MPVLPPTVEAAAALPEDRTARRCLRAARWAGLAAAAIGLAALAGWTFDILPLMTVLPGLVRMRPNTAMCLVASGWSLWIFARGKAEAGGRLNKLGVALAAGVMGMGALTLVQYAAGVDLGIDEMLFEDPVASGAPGRISPISSCNFCMLGLALIVLRLPHRAGWAQALAGGAAATSLLAVVGRFYGVPSLYQAGNFTAVALHTATASLLLCAGVWCAASRHGFMRVITGSGMAGTLARRYGVAAILLPLATGWLRTEGVHRGWFGAEMGSVFVTIASAVTFAALVWTGASWLSVAERRQAQAQARLREGEERLNFVVEQLTEGLVISDLEGRFLYWNQAALDMHLFARREDGMRTLREFGALFELSDLEGKIIPVEQWPMARIVRGERLDGYDACLRRLDASKRRILRYGGRVAEGAGGKPLAFLTITDVTEQKRMEEAEEEALKEVQQARLELEVRVLERTSELAAANARLEEQMLERAKAESANEQIMNHSLDLICTFDAEGRFLQVSRACETLFGYPPEDLLGRPFLAMVHPDDQAKTIAAAEAIMAGEAINEFENRYTRADGKIVPIVWSARWSAEQQAMFCVARDMTERHRVESELRAARDAAEAASRAKSEFLANMSHEIRTPMNGILGMTELVLDTPLDRQQREYLGMAKASADTLLSLINDILDFSKIEAGKLELEAIPFSLRDCIGALLKPLGLRADLKGLELTADLPAATPDCVVGDPMRLRQVLINLTDNAIKFTARGDVTLSVAVEAADDEAEHRLRFTVRDTGIGIAPAKQALIFEAFAQADGTTTRTYGGTGLGLAIATRLVAAMGGRIWVESTPGEGTAFHFTSRFPVCQAPSNGSNPRAAPERLEGQRALIVDDNAVNRRVLREILTSWRMRPTVVASGSAALTEMLGAGAAGEPFPLVLIDGLMPDMDGFMVVEKMREHPELVGAAVMMLSSAMGAGAAARCGELGVASYLTKPISQSELLDAVLAALGPAAETLPPERAPQGAAAATEVAGPAIPRPAGAAPALAGADLRILLVEDNAINRMLATSILQRRGHSLVHAANGREAVDAVAREPFDLVFMDLQMPEMDGFEATRCIREAEAGSGRRTRIAAMTAYAMAGDRERCLAAGMDDYLSKPVQKLELYALLERVVAGRGAAPTLNSPPPAVEPGVIFDRAVILDQLDGDELLLRQVVGLFREKTPGSLEDLRRAGARRDAVALERGAHSLLGSLGVFGAFRAHELTQAIEAQAQAGDFAATASTLDALDAEIQKIYAAMDELAPAQSI